MQKRIKNKNFFWKLAALIVPIICVFLTYFLTNASTQETFVERLSVYFDVVDENMSYEQALHAMRNESNMQKNQINELKTQLNDLNAQISVTPSFDLKSSTLVSNGLNLEKNINNSIAIINNDIYYSQNLLDLILKDKLFYKIDKNTVFYDESGANIFSETKIDLFDTNVLYGGVCYKVFLPSEGETFSMGSNTYNSGFEIYDDHSLFGEGDGYALFDLGEHYSKITFDVGRTNEYNMEDVVLKVYLNDKYVEEYSLNAQSPPVTLEINLNYAKNMKLEITGGSSVKYGFANVILHY